MKRTNRNYAFTTAFVEALAGLGLRHVCITPGSRNSPLAFAFADHPGITDWIHHDERSAAFFALGAAATTRRPVAVVTTSGTAAVELHPAAVEARLSRVPLLLLTADRPPELRDVGAPQAIDQLNLFGTAAKWFHHVATPDPRLGRYPATLATRAWATALDLPAGPVHLNFPFREPLAPVVVPGDVEEPSGAWEPRRYVPGRIEIDPAALEEIGREVSARRTLLIAGPLDRPLFPEAAAALAARARLPIVADPLSQLRAGDHDRTHVITTGDPLARVGRFDTDLRPEVVIRFGAMTTSKALASWLADHAEVPQIVIEEADWRDPGASATTMVRTDPVSFARQLAEVIEAAPSDWATAWIDADRVARANLTGSLVFPSEPAVVAALAAAIPDETILYVGSSMPIRDVDAFFPSIDRRVRILSNRGANGIDGLISSGLGAAAAGQPVVILSGDLSLLHDLTALGAAARFGLPVTVIVVNNDGGGIFHFLPQAAFPKHFERLLGTPHGTDFQAAADLFGIEHHLVESNSIFTTLVGMPTESPRLIEVRTDRSENVAIHDKAWQAVAGS
ncbi:MAG: 2-succinyl-5-enolpyruvyl-6-hydroxy-3-cyclohexene-1-carboxylic-acid synthase [Acidimicrobiia bacterium]|nr:2-succinyl-5-enolpyruvyl-6-hydroxy-3-cyclohexene-1-carboxylic-acid synthase [Acidimicrobiia bacterium]MDH3398573.1 2-succinyl-5-enolpyruvyl-6-hydroxy-3-cyclohexene-1-carboxylic-acid synthase [Acidimicrobiia bacterium]